MAPLPTNITILFFAVTAIVFLVLFWRGKEWKRLTLENLRKSWPCGVGVAAGAAVIYAAFNWLGLDILAGLFYFIGGFLSLFLLVEIGMPMFLRSLLLLFGGVALTLLLPAENYAQPLVGALAGLVTAKAMCNIVRSDETTLADLLPVFVWLTGSYWFVASGSYAKAAVDQSLLLSTITIAVFLRWVQMPLLFEDRAYVKRVVLSATGGLLVLIVVTKLLLAVQLTRIAWLAGGAFLGSYILESLDKKSEGSKSLFDALSQIIVIGLLTILASRLFGCEGLLVLAASTVVIAKSPIPRIAGFFWALRVLQQAFIAQFNSNVTGININHEYAGAAIYLGFVLVIVASLLLRDLNLQNLKAKAIAALIFVTTGVVLAAASTFFLHAEPTASLLISSLVASVIVSVCAGTLYRSSILLQENLMLWTAQLCAFAIIFNELLDMGNNASVTEKLYVIASIAAVLIIASIICFTASGGSRSKPVEVSGDQL